MRQPGRSSAAKEKESLQVPIGQVDRGGEIAIVGPSAVPGWSDPQGRTIRQLVAADVRTSSPNDLDPVRINQPKELPSRVSAVCFGGRRLKGRRQNPFVASGDFLQRMTNVGWQGFAAQLHPYHMLG